jgi:hypothetical protein
MKSDVIEAMKEYNADLQREIAKKGHGHTRINPLPTRGLYDAAFNDVGAFVTTSKDDPTIRYLNVKLSFRAIGGDQDGLTLERTFWGSSEYDQGALFDFTTVLAGEKPEDTEQALALLDGREGTTCRLKVREFRKKDESVGKTLEIVG